MAELAGATISTTTQSYGSGVQSGAWTTSLVSGLVVPIPTLPDEAMTIKGIAVDVEATSNSSLPKSLLDRMKNCFSGLVPDISSKEAVAAAEYISNLGEIEALEEKVF